MGLKKKLFVIIFSVVFIHTCFSQSAPENKDYSELLIGSKTVEMFDSLANTTFFHSSLFREDMSVKDKYPMPASYIPEYNDSLIRERIADMNAASPIEFRYNDDVMAHIDFYLKRRSFIARLLGLTELYFPMFEEELSKYDLPMELKFVTIIESALNPIAKSRAGACGLWQFMLRTGQMYGMNSSSYVEDRFDPYKATDAACRHFIDLYKIYGDWALCLAAYNAGAGRINRAIKQSGNRVDYWIIRDKLPRETQKYVPAFIAAAYVFTYYVEHNIRPLVPVIIDTQIDTVAVKAELTFNVISNMLDIPMEHVEMLNPAYKKKLIPAPAGQPYMLRLPKDKVLRFVELELDMYYTTYSMKYPNLMQDYITKNGLTVFEGEFRTEHSIRLNEDDSTSIDKRKILKTIQDPGHLISIVRTHDPSGTSARTTTSGGGSSGSSSASPTGTHTVRSGESLGVIARMYGCSVNQIMQWNNLSGHTIHPGQKLKVSGTATATTNTTTTNTTTTQSQQSSGNTTQGSSLGQGGGNVNWHTVKQGDSLWAIANRYNTTVERIKADNNLTGNNLSIGQKLKITTGK